MDWNINLIESIQTFKTAAAEASYYKEMFWHSCEYYETTVAEFKQYILI